MNILLLGPHRPEMVEFLTSFGDKVAVYEKKLLPDAPLLDGIDFIISYGYRYILQKEIVRQFNKRAINLHISYLPWNRGADPNLWSILEDTPKGVTIHYMDEGLDTGDIIAQKEVFFDKDDTLKTSYEKLSVEMFCLFKEKWPFIREGQVHAIPQSGKGSFHRVKDKEPYLALLTQGWDTPISNLSGLLSHNIKH